LCNLTLLSILVKDYKKTLTYGTPDIITCTRCRGLEASVLMTKRRSLIDAGAGIPKPVF